MAKAIKATVEIKVVFDTNVLYSGSAHNLFNETVTEFVVKHSDHKDIKLTWILPSVVQHERLYQMTKESLRLLPSVEKLERVLGHNLAITQDICQDRIKAIVNKQIDDLCVVVHELDTENIDWPQIITASVYRTPPFDPGDKEKGFRDALIVESLWQIIGMSPKKASQCRIVFMSADQLVRVAVEKRCEGIANFRVMSNFDELESFINSIASEVSEAFIAELSKKAKPLFYEKDNKESLYLREGVRRRINNDFVDVLSILPEGVKRRENDDTWYVYDPVFLGKSRSIVKWSSKVRVPAKGYAEKQESALTRLFEASAKLSLDSEGRLFGINSPAPVGASQEDLKMTGNTFFEIVWSHQWRTNGTISHVNLIEIRYLETAWEPVKSE